MRYSEKVILVTGGGSGIGRSVCELSAAEGAHVVVVDLQAERAAEVADAITADGHQALAVTTDVSDGAAVADMAQATLERFGRVDVVVNNAGIAAGDDILTFDEATWDLNLNVVLKSVFLVSRALLPQMLERQSGSIVNVSSVNGQFAVGEEAYSAAKAGMLNLTQNMALKYGPRGVRVNAVCPGTIRTPIWGEVVARQPDVFERIARIYPLGRVGEPEDVARAILFLACDEAAWITGQTLSVDGGLTAGPFRLWDAADLDLGEHFGGTNEDDADSP